MTTFSVIFEHRSGSAPNPLPICHPNILDRDISLCVGVFIFDPPPPERNDVLLHLDCRSP